MALENLYIYASRREARRAKRRDEVIIKACGGYALIDGALYRVIKRRAK